LTRIIYFDISFLEERKMEKRNKQESLGRMTEGDYKRILSKVEALSFIRRHVPVTFIRLLLGNTGDIFAECRIMGVDRLLRVAVLAIADMDYGVHQYCPPSRTVLLGLVVPVKQQLLIYDLQRASVPQAREKLAAR
jgi:hypothetical protein